MMPESQCIHILPCVLSKTLCYECPLPRWCYAVYVSQLFGEDEKASGMLKSPTSSVTNKQTDVHFRENEQRTSNHSLQDLQLISNAKFSQLESKYELTFDVSLGRHQRQQRCHLGENVRRKQSSSYPYYFDLGQQYLPSSIMETATASNYK